MKIFPDYLPPEFGALLLGLALILVVAPYAAGHDFGLISIPSFQAKTKSLLKWLGPVIMLAILAMHIPLPAYPCNKPIFEGITDGGKCGYDSEVRIIEEEKPRACSHESFGQAGWRYTEEITRKSEWVRGGAYQPNWCNVLIQTVAAEKSIGGLYESEVVARSEQGRWAGALNTVREYQYNCQVRIEWEAIYNERIDPDVCGVIPATTTTVQIPRTCKTQVSTASSWCAAR